MKYANFVIESHFLLAAYIKLEIDWGPNGQASPSLRNDYVCSPEKMKLAWKKKASKCQYGTRIFMWKYKVW